MFQKFLFIGLGGSGGKTLRFLKKQIKGWLQEHEAGTEIPAGWGFLHIDVPENPDGRDIDRFAPPLAENEYLSLVPFPVTFEALQQGLDAKNALASELISWRVDPAGIALKLAGGAGQFRAVGAAISMSQIKLIATALKDAHNKLNVDDVTSELGDLYFRVFGKHPESAVDKSYTTVVVSSLAGGSGAGMLSLVCDMLRGILPDGDDPSLAAILYTPEVFSGLAGAAKHGIQGNSLAALGELLASVWYGSNAQKIESPLLGGVGIARVANLFGPRYPFLVGRKGAGGVTYKSPNDLYSSVAQSLLSWTTDLAMQDRMSAYIEANWTAGALHMAPANKDLLVTEGEISEKGLPPFSALGFSRLSVGADYLENYASEVLAHDAYTHLVDYHTESAEANAVKDQTDEHDPDRLAALIAGEHKKRFQEQAGLSSADDIFSMLNPKNQESIYSVVVKTICTQSGIGDPTVAYEFGEWRNAIEGNTQNILSPTNPPAEFKDAALRQKQDWIENIQKRLLAAISDLAEHRGLKIACVVLRETHSYLITDITQELDGMISQNIGWANDWRNPEQYPASLANEPGKIEGNNPDLEIYVRSVASYLWRQYIADICRDAANLVSQLCTRLIRPVADELERAHREAISQHEEFSEWSTWLERSELPEPDEAIGPHYGNFTLIGSGEYQGLLKEKMTESFGSNWREDVRRATIRGLAEENGLISATQWQPEGQELPPTFSQAEVHTSRGDLLESVASLLNREGSPMEKVLRLSLRSSLEVQVLGGGEYYGDRLINRLRACIDAAAPLVDINHELLPVVHAHADPAKIYQIYFSSLPFAGTKLANEVNALVSADKDGAQAVPTDERARHIDITSVMSAPLSPLVFKSLLDPIASDWEAFRVADDTKSFWHNRSTKPLARAVPCSQATLLAMTRGWFTARLLGLVTSLPVKKGKGKTSALIITRRWDGENNLDVEFLSPLLSQPRTETDYPGVLFESLILAYTQVSSKGSTDPLVPYICLRDLGTDSTLESLSDYATLHECLESWVTSGDLPDGAVIGNALLPVTPDLSVDKRQRILLEQIDEQRELYGDLYRDAEAKWEIDPTLLSKAPVWMGMWDLMIDAFNDLKTATEQV